MKKLLILFALTLTLFSCKEDEILEHREVVIVHYEYLYAQANYIKYDSTIILRENLPDTGYTVAPLLAKVVFDSKNNISMKYLGGYHNYDYVDCGVPQQLELDANKKYIFDTITITNTVNISYAIFELVDGNTTWKDTVLYYIPQQWSTVCSQFYFRCTDTTSVSYVMCYSDRFFNDYSVPFTHFKEDIYKNQILLQINKKHIYMMDIFPYSADPIDSAQMVLFFK